VDVGKGCGLGAKCSGASGGVVDGRRQQFSSENSDKETKTHEAKAPGQKYIRHFIVIRPLFGV